MPACPYRPDDFAGTALLAPSRENIIDFASDLLTLVWFSLIPIVWPAVFLGLHLAVSVIQAFVFMLLSMIYLSMAVSHEH